MEGMVLLSGSSEAKDPKILRVGRGSGIMSYILCNAKSPLWLSFHTRWLRLPGHPITAGLLAPDPLRPVHQIPLLEKQKPTVDAQQEVKLKGLPPV